MYGAAVGALGWITSVRVDVCFSFSRLSQHLKEPTTAAWEALQRTMGYLYANPSMCISKHKMAKPEWKFYTDSDHGGNTDTTFNDEHYLKPQLGIVATYGGRPL